MRYEIDTDRIKKHMGKTSFIHKSDTNVKVMPYKTKYIENAQEIKALVGEVARRCVHKIPKESIKKEVLIENIKCKVTGDKKEEIIAFIEKLYFDKDGHLELFHPKVFAYLENIEQIKNEQKRVGKFVYDVLFKDIDQEKIEKVFNQKGDLMVQLIMSVLPELKEMDEDDEYYMNYAPFVKEVFEEDMAYVLEDNKRFIKCFDKLLEYYYFYYTSQAILKLNQHQKADLMKQVPIYFRLSGEIGGKNRASYLQGYRLVKGAVESLFANVMLVQFLSYNKWDEHNKIKSLPQWYEEYILPSTEEEKEWIAKGINEFTDYYQGAIDKVDWSKVEEKKNTDETVVDQAIKRLADSIALQFTVGGRSGKARDYSDWFTNYCKDHYLERRGNLGYMLTVDDEDILFMTGICIKDKDNMRLSELYKEFERRGLYFDDLSKEAIVAIYEKSNLLEKKSDSGDAQYVRSIL